jgi:hypothetical protein
MHAAFINDVFINEELSLLLRWLLFKLDFLLAFFHPLRGVLSLTIKC